MLTLSLGMHWALLQTVAWAGMIVKFAHRDSVPVALAKTFDGRHPCKICKLVESGKKSEKSHQSAKPSKQLDFYILADRLSLSQPPAFQYSHQHRISSTFRAEEPPIPPPRIV